MSRLEGQPAPLAYVGLGKAHTGVCIMGLRLPMLPMPGTRAFREFISASADFWDDEAGLSVLHHAVRDKESSHQHEYFS